MNRNVIDDHICTKGLCKTYKENEENINVDKKGKSYNLKNNNNSIVRVFDLDDCVFPNSDQKLCDYLLIVRKNSDKKEIVNVWIELKGSDINHACKQILNSFQKLKNKDNTIENYARIVPSRNKKQTRGDAQKSLLNIFKQKFDSHNIKYEKDSTNKFYIRTVNIQT